MNKRIPNGSWCLFREVSDGSRNGKVVIVQSRGIQDPDTGGQYTVKIYQSEKAETQDSWSHRIIRLEPDSMDFNFKPLTLEPDTTNDLRVIAALRFGSGRIDSLAPHGALTPAGHVADTPVQPACKPSAGLGRISPTFGGHAAKVRNHRSSSNGRNSETLMTRPCCSNLSSSCSALCGGFLARTCVSSGS